MKIKLLLLIYVVVSGSLSAQVPTPFASFPFDDDFLDENQNVISQYMGNVTIVDNAVRGKVAYFPGGDPNNADSVHYLNLGTNIYDFDAVTYNIWFNAAEVLMWSRVLTMSTLDPDGLYPEAFITPWSGRHALKLTWTIDAGIGRPGNPEDDAGMEMPWSGTIEVGKWYMITASQDATNMKLWINGELAGDSVHTAGKPSDLFITKAMIGKGGWPDRLLHGWIDDFKVFDRVLTNDEVAAIYNAEKTKTFTINDSLVAHFPFNGNANDESGNNYHGTVFGATLTDDRFGNANSAYLFTASNNDHITLNAAAGNFGTSDFTISVWANRNTAAGYELFAQRNRGDRDSSWWELGWALFDVNESSDNYSVINIGSHTLKNNTWYHFVGVRDNKTIKFYVNSELYGINVTPSIQNIINVENSEIACQIYAGSPVQCFDGIIDDIRLYNRALSSGELLALYNENLCSDTETNETVIYYVSSSEFSNLSPKVYFESTDSLLTSVGGCDSIIHHYSQYIYDATHCTDTTHISVNDSIAVTDTLLIDVELTGINPPDNVNIIKVYPNPTKDIIYIHTGTLYEQMIDYKIKIINTSGSMIFESNITQQLFEIDISDFGQTGLYFIQIINDSNQIIDIRKIILE